MINNSNVTQCQPQHCGRVNFSVIDHPFIHLTPGLLWRQPSAQGSTLQWGWPVLGHSPMLTSHFTKGALDVLMRWWPQLNTVSSFSLFILFTFLHQSSKKILCLSDLLLHLLWCRSLNLEDRLREESLRSKEERKRFQSRASVYLHNTMLKNRIWEVGKESGARLGWGHIFSVWYLRNSGEAVGVGDLWGSQGVWELFLSILAEFFHNVEYRICLESPLKLLHITGLWLCKFKPILRWYHLRTLDLFVLRNLVYVVEHPFFQN